MVAPTPATTAGCPRPRVRRPQSRAVGGRWLTDEGSGEHVNANHRRPDRPVDPSPSGYLLGAAVWGEKAQRRRLAVASPVVMPAGASSMTRHGRRTCLLYTSDAA